MKRSIKLIHIEKLAKENIFMAYRNMSKAQYYEMETNNALYVNSLFWEEIKRYCNKIPQEFLLECKSYPQDYDYFVLVNVDCTDGISNDEPLDYIAIQYLLALLFHIDKNYTVCFYTTSSDMEASSNYYRLSAFLNLWVARGKKKNNFRYLDAQAETFDKNDGFNPKRLAYSFVHDTPSETILPIIELDRKMYACLDRPYNIEKKPISLNQMLGNLDNDKETQLHYAYYEEYIYQAIEKMLKDTKTVEHWRDLENSFLKSSPSLIVVYIYAIIKSHIETTDFSTLTFQVLIERSFDYAHGLMQLIENSIKHVIMKEKSSCAFFTIRMHHKIGALNQYLNNPPESVFKELKYFLEFSVLDCVLNSKQTGIVYRYNEALKKANIKPIKDLHDIFEFPYSQSLSLEEYYSQAFNVANHYGLQIFDTILTSNDGLFIVQSGSFGSSSIYTNVKKIRRCGKDIYKVNLNDLPTKHFSGTSYTIILPIENLDSGMISSHLSLCNTPLRLGELQQETECIPLLPIKWMGAEKETLVMKYVDKINKEFADDGCSIIALNINEISKNRINLELLCKAIISIIANTQKKNLSVICLLDICDEYRLLDAIRVIALFYDKTGHCSFVQNKGIYLASQNRYDILFSGNDIKSVLENIERQRLIKKLPDNFYRHIIAALKDRIEGD